jgi:hypothetical protein
VAVAAIDEPALDAVRCVRADLARQARFYDAPVWCSASADNAYWQVSAWQVADSPAATFVAVKAGGAGSGAPPARLAVSPTY